jgi:Cd2+/Zn2+-exporting ATPase
MSDMSQKIISILRQAPVQPHSHDHGHGKDEHGHDHGVDACCGHDHGHSHELEGGHDHDHDHPLAHDHEHGGDACCGHEHGQAGGTNAAAASAAGAAVLQAAAGELVTRIRIGQMDCPTEEGLIRKKLGGMQAVRDMHFDLMQRILTVVHVEGSGDALVGAIRTLGMTPEVLEGTAPAAPVARARTHWGMLATAGVLAALAEIVHYMGAPNWATAALAVASVLACGLTTYRKGWIAVRNGNLNINALMSIAVTGAAIIGQWPEAAMVMFLFNVAEVIEARSLDRARNAVRGLLDLAPPNATVRQADGSWLEVAAASLVVDNVVRVRPGERIAADGIVTTGASSVDQSPITGESMPAEKTIGDAVYAATVNGEGAFEYRVTAAAQDTTLARIIHAVEQAQGARAPTQRFIDSFARIYTPVVVLVAVLAACVPPLLLNMPWADAVYRALALLIIACPCALVISTPVSIVSGLTAASRRGILVKGGVYLESGRRLRWLGLDKTGTLTHGKPALTDLKVLDGAAESITLPANASADAALETSNPASASPAAALSMTGSSAATSSIAGSSAAASSVASSSVALIAASLAARSDHPVSRAIATAADASSLHEVEDFAALPGRGIKGTINGVQYHMGNRRLLQDLGLDTPALTEELHTLEAQGKTAVALVGEGRALAVAAVADTVREDSASAIAALHGLGVNTFMLSGDNHATVRAIAGKVGIKDARGEQLPADKLAALESHLGDGLVGMVGDGINDAPALARADIGFAMGAAGTGTAIETADVALMDDDLRKIGEFVRLSRATHSVLVQNIVLALGIKAVFLVLALTGYATLWMAVFADVGASLLVVANGLRLLRAGDGRLAVRNTSAD